jgi:hypothetical protein
MGDHPSAWQAGQIEGVSAAEFDTFRPESSVDGLSADGRPERRSTMGPVPAQIPLTRYASPMGAHPQPAAVPASIPQSRRTEFHTVATTCHGQALAAGRQV